MLLVLLPAVCAKVLGKNVSQFTSLMVQNSQRAVALVSICTTPNMNNYFGRHVNSAFSSSVKSTRNQMLRLIAKYNNLYKLIPQLCKAIISLVLDNLS